MQELMEGGSLWSQFYDRSWVPTERQRVHTALGIASGVAYLHSLKPPIVVCAHAARARPSYAL